MYWEFYSDLDEMAAKNWKDKKLQDIIDTVDTFDVRPYLFEKGIISLAEYEETLCRRVTCQPIINMLFKHSPSDLPFIHLRLAMKEHWSHVVEKIDASIVGKSLVNCSWRMILPSARSQELAMCPEIRTCVM